MAGRAFARNLGRAMPKIGFLTVSVGLVLALSSPAWADTVTVPNSPPVISGLTSELTMRPDANSSTNTYGSGVNGVYTINLTVSDVDRIADLSSVTLCLYHVTEGDPTCADTSGSHVQNAKNTVLLSWARTDESFSIDATAGSGATNAPDASWWALGHGSESAGRDENNSLTSTNTNPTYSYANYSPSASAMDMRFTFRISEAAREGAWGIRAIATDIDNGRDTVNDTTGYSMGWYGAIEAQRASFDFGQVESGSTSDANDVSAGLVQANGGSDIDYKIIDNRFIDGDKELVNAGGTVGSLPGNGQFAYDCDADSTFNLTTGPDTTGTRVIDSEREVERGQFAVDSPTSAVEEEGTTESPDNRSKQSCRLYVGPDNVKGSYEGTVVTGITQDAP